MYFDLFTTTHFAPPGLSIFSLSLSCPLSLISAVHGYGAVHRAQKTQQMKGMFTTLGPAHLLFLSLNLKSAPRCYFIE